MAKQERMDVSRNEVGTLTIQEPPKAATELVVSEYRALARPTTEIKARIKEAVGTAGLTAFNLDRIKVPSGESNQWSVPTLKGNVPVPSFDAVILEMRDSRSYWKEPYGGGGNNPPDCSSSDAIIGIGVPGGPCRRCPLAQFGTAVKPNGKPAKGQACRQGKMMLLLRPTDLIPIMLVIPPGSLKENNKFLMRFTQSDLSPRHVVMRFALNLTKNSDGVAYNQVHMEMVRPLNTEELDRMLSIQQMFTEYFAEQALNADDVAGE